MSRKKPQKRNIEIGIFTNKSKAYNQAILETLYTLQAATTWQIAKTLQKKLRPTSNTKAATQLAHDIFSVIQRKNGRLEDLERKGYVVSNQGLWMLTLKGSIAIGIKNLGLVDLELKADMINRWELTIKTLPDEKLKAPFGFSLDTVALKNDASKLVIQLKKNPAIFKFILEQAKELLMEGVNLDAINEFSLAFALAAREPVKQVLSKLSQSLS